MICEPSHYYMAKYGITDESFLFRKKWDSGSYGRFEDFLSGEEFKYLVVPAGPRTDKIINQFIAPELMKKILDGKIECLVLHKSFKFGSNSLLLFRITPFPIRNPVNERPVPEFKVKKSPKPVPVVIPPANVFIKQ